MKTEDRPVLVETRNVKAVKQAVQNTLLENGFLAIVAEVGSGKTLLFNHLTEKWEAKPEKFVVVRIKSFKHLNSRIGTIMELMIEALDPELTIPKSIERRYEILRRLLRQAEHEKRYVIVIVDEAQDVNLQTLRDLKKIHELAGTRTHLFSIVLFGKNMGKIWDLVFKSPELGYRIRRVRLDALTNEEVALMAEQRFHLRFASDRVKEKFVAMLTHRTPLGIQWVAEALHNLPEFESARRGEYVHITLEVLHRLPMARDKFRLDHAGIKHREVAERVKHDYPQLNISPPRVSEFLAGKPVTEAVGEAIAETIERMIVEAYSSRSA